MLYHKRASTYKVETTCTTYMVWTFAVPGDEIT